MNIDSHYFYILYANLALEHLIQEADAIVKWEDYATSTDLRKVEDGDEDEPEDSGESETDAGEKE